VCPSKCTPQSPFSQSCKLPGFYARETCFYQDKGCLSKHDERAGSNKTLQDRGREVFGVQDRGFRG
jgi:hypothetical protein